MRCSVCTTTSLLLDSACFLTLSFWSAHLCSQSLHFTISPPFEGKTLLLTIVAQGQNEWRKKQKMKTKNPKPPSAHTNQNAGETCQLVLNLKKFFSRLDFPLICWWQKLHLDYQVLSLTKISTSFVLLQSTIGLEFSFHFVSEFPPNGTCKDLIRILGIPNIYILDLEATFPKVLPASKLGTMTVWK